MILNAYYDESGTHAGSPVTVLAGLVGTAERWIDFNREWNKVLKKYNIKFVHAKHLFHRQGMFKGWSDERAWRCACDFMYVIQERHQLFVSRSQLFEDDYITFYRAKKTERKERLDSRYALCFRAFMHFLPEYHRSRFERGHINFILEAGHKNAGDALRVFKEIKTDRSLQWGDVIGSISFDGKEGFPALQAADMFAYYYFHMTKDGMIDDPNRRFWPSHFERELSDSGVNVLAHSIEPDDLINLRMNFYLREKRPVFQKAMLFARDYYKRDDVDFIVRSVEPSSAHIHGPPPFIRNAFWPAKRSA